MIILLTQARNVWAILFSFLCHCSWMIIILTQARYVWAILFSFYVIVALVFGILPFKAPVYICLSFVIKNFAANILFLAINFRKNYRNISSILAQFYWHSYILKNVVLVLSQIFWNKMLCWYCSVFLFIKH